VTAVFHLRTFLNEAIFSFVFIQLVADGFRLRNQRQMKNSLRAEQFASTSSEKLALVFTAVGFQNNEKTMEHG
jgi:hypothetical protein